MWGYDFECSRNLLYLAFFFSSKMEKKEERTETPMKKNHQ